MLHLHVNKISKRFGNDWVLRDVELKCHTGHIFGILGPTASGKSTLLKIIAGKLKSNGGSVTVDNEQSTGFSYYDGLDPKPLLGIFGVGAKKLSSGERQVAALENALANSSSVLLLDDPFRDMDHQLRSRCFEAVRRSASDKITIFASADLDQIAHLADEMAVLLGGEVAQTGPPQDVYDMPETAAVARVTGENNIFAARRLTSTDADQPEFQTIDGGHRVFAKPVTKARLGAINQNVMLAIRPEQVMMSLGASFPEDNLLKAVVTGIDLLGPTSLVYFDAGGLEISARVFRVVGLRAGDECMLSLPRDRIQVLKD